MSARPVLYVDDDPDIRTLVGMALARDPGFDPVLAGSGAEALRLIAAGLRPVLAIVDLSMPNMDGFALHDALRLSTGGRRLPVIFMTASGHPHAADLLRGRDALGVIPKPFDPLALPQHIRALLGRRTQY